jgi:hypothetical protein
MPEVQFVGGETAEQCYPVMAKLAASGCGTFLGYSVEGVDSGQTDAAEVAARIDEMVSSIRAVGNFPTQAQTSTGIKSNCVAIKRTRLSFYDSGGIRVDDHAYQSEFDSQWACLGFVRVRASVFSSRFVVRLCTRAARRSKHHRTNVPRAV